MIDFHTHILPGIDDGAKNMEETMNLLLEATRYGIDEIVLTSHYIEDYYDINVEDRQKLLSNIKNALDRNNINIKLYLGNEIYISNNINKLIKENKASTINNTRYILFEMPFNSKPINLYDVVYEMLQYKFVPILAHPERYSFIQQNPSIVNDLIETGVLMQCNYGSFIGQYGKKAQIIIKKLLKNNLVDFMGSDVHRINTIYPKISQILNQMEKFVGKDQLEQITVINPKLVLEDKKIEMKEPVKIQLSLLEKIIMKK